MKEPSMRGELWEVERPDNSKLYDRDDQTKLLLNAYERCCRHVSGAQREMVVITGPSGAGKTALACQLKDRVEQEGSGYFISGKFDQLAATAYQATSKSYEPLVVACNEFCHQAVAKGGENVTMVKSAIRQALNAVELSVLVDSIPALRMILGSSQHTATKRSSCGGLARGVDAEDRFGRIFCRFLLSVCSGYQPGLVLFLDDLQWANRNALEILKTLAVAEKGMARSKLMILGTYRDDEVLPQHPLSVTMDDLRQEGVMLTNIAVSSMSQVAANEMIADILDLSVDKCQNLAITIYDKTGGNAFFIKQLLRCLREDRLLTFDETGELKCDEIRLLPFMDNDSVLELLINKVNQLPEKAKEVLKVASCLGLAFDESVVWAAGKLEKADVSFALKLAEERGLVVVNHGQGNGCFVHDKVQQAAYSLIPEQERPLFHLNIGRKIFPIVPPKVDDAHLLLLAEQISRGITLVKDPSEKVAFAELYLRAGEKAARSSAYSNAAAFLALGVGLIDAESWTEKYALALTLHNTAAEVECYNGNFDRVDALVATVFKRAHTFDDTLKAHFTRIYSLGSRNDMIGCVNEALKLLDVLGQSFPQKVSNLHATTAMMRCRGALRGKSDDDIIRLPLMKDTTTLAAIQLMILIAFWANGVRKQLAPLLAVRVIMLTVRHGMNDMCCAGFATLSLILSIRGDYDQAYRYGNLALQIFDTHEAEEWHARVGGSVYGGIYPMKHPYRLSLQPLLAAHRSGLVLGDIHFSSVCLFFYCSIGFCSGANLAHHIKETTAFRDLSVRYRVNTAVTTISIVLQTLHNFSGMSADPLILTGEALNEEQCLLATNGKHPIAYLLVLIYKHQLAVYMNNFSEAEKLLSKMQRMDLSNVFPVIRSWHEFMEGLTAARLSASSKKYRKHANQVLTKLRGYAKHCPHNFQSKILLVEAELAASAGDVEDALDKYRNAAERANSQALIQEEALAHERAGHCLRECGRAEEAKACFGQAISRYNSWGAQTKVDDLRSIQF